MTREIKLRGKFGGSMMSGIKIRGDTNFNFVEKSKD
jgi:hypothetical protein